MKAIEQTSLALLAASLLFLAFVAAGFALDRYMSHAPLFRAPPESRDFSYVKSLEDATNLEGLRKACLFWAEREDQTKKFMSDFYNQLSRMIRELLTLAVVLAAIFSGGLLYIYLTARRLVRSQHNAL